MRNVEEGRKYERDQQQSYKYSQSSLFTNGEPKDMKGGLYQETLYKSFKHVWIWGGGGVVVDGEKPGVWAGSKTNL